MVKDRICQFQGNLRKISPGAMLNNKNNKNNKNLRCEFLKRVGLLRRRKKHILKILNSVCQLIK